MNNPQAEIRIKANLKDLDKAVQYAAKEMGVLPKTGKEWDNVTKSIHRNLTNLSAEAKRYRSLIETNTRLMAHADDAHLEKLKKQTSEYAKHLKYQEDSIRTYTRMENAAKGRRDELGISATPGSLPRLSSATAIAHPTELLSSAGERVGGAMMGYGQGLREGNDGSLLKLTAGLMSSTAGLALLATAGAPILSKILTDIIFSQIKPWGDFQVMGSKIGLRNNIGSGVSDSILANSGAWAKAGYGPQDALEFAGAMPLSIFGKGWMGTALSEARFAKSQGIDAGEWGATLREGYMSGGRTSGTDTRYQRFLSTAMALGVSQGMDKSRAISNMVQLQRVAAEGTGATTPKGLESILALYGAMSRGTENRALWGEKGVGAIETANKSFYDNVGKVEWAGMRGLFYGPNGKGGLRRLSGRDYNSSITRLMQEYNLTRPDAVKMLARQSESLGGIAYELPALMNEFKGSPYSTSMGIHFFGEESPAGMALMTKYAKGEMSVSKFRSEMAKLKSGTPGGEYSGEAQKFQSLNAKYQLSNLTQSKSMMDIFGGEHGLLSGMMDFNTDFGTAVSKFADAVSKFTGENKTTIEPPQWLKTIASHLKKLDDANRKMWGDKAVKH